MPEGTVYFDGTSGFRDSWQRPYFADEDYLKVVNGMPITCTDIIWVGAKEKVFYLAWRAVHSTKGPWMFGGRQRRGEAPREAARRLLLNEVGTDIAAEDLFFIQWAICFSEFRVQAPQDSGAHYVLFHYGYLATQALVESAAKKLEPKEYDLTHGIRPYGRSDLLAIDPQGPYAFNRAILLEEYERVFGP